MSIFTTKYNTSQITSEQDVNSKNSNSGLGWSGSTWTGVLEKPDRDYVRASILSDVGGTVFFDFSNDGTNVSSTFPVAGFSLATFHEYHGADLAGRYFRIRIVFDSLPTNINISTYYSDNAPSLNSPLSQSISGDQDATTVKAVIHGEDKDSPGTFVQGKMTSDGAVRTSIVSALIDFEHDSYIKVNSSTTTDRYDYYLGGLAGTKVAEILVTYETTGKNEVISSEKTIL